MVALALIGADPSPENLAPMNAQNGPVKSNYRALLGQRGALVPMLALSLAVVMIVGMVIAGVATESSKRAHAQAAADATALAGAAGGESSAVRMAHKYSADLLLFTIDGTTVSVVLLVDGIESHAHADRHLVATGRG